MTASTHNPHQSQPLTQNLRTLVLLRWMLVIALLLSLAAAFFQLHLSLEYQTLLGLIAGFSCLNVLTAVRINSFIAVNHFEFMAQLSVDIIGLSVLLYFTGGATNPFVSYLLIPLCIAATTLPLGYTLVTAGLCISCYWWLLSSYIPVQSLAPLEHAHHAMASSSSSSASLHTYGMWLNFIFSAAIITTFLTRMTATLRKQDSIIQQQREHVLHAEQLTAIATLAAGAAHELSTPLTTIKIAAHEIIQIDSSATEEAQVIVSQIEQCQKSLDKLRAQAQAGMAVTPTKINALNWLEETIDQWLLINPHTTLLKQLDLPSDSVWITADATLTQSLINLMNNAAEHSVAPISLNVALIEDTDIAMQLQIDIRDNGESVPTSIKQHWGKPFNSNKSNGMGLGVYLSNSTIERHKGQLELIEFENYKITRVRIPVTGLL